MFSDTALNFKTSYAGDKAAYPSNGSSSSAAQQREQGPYSLVQIINGLNIITETLTAGDGKCKGSCCNCAAVPALIWRLEQEDNNLNFVTMMEENLYDCLIKAAAALLEGDHSARALRRTTEAFDW
jgi:hypothetical protein